jgi:hypothetical protein
VWGFDGASGQWMLDPSVLQPSKGYWVKSKDKYVVSINGQPKSIIMKLYSGWNLISVPFDTPTSNIKNQADLEWPVWGFDGASGQWMLDPSVLQPGKGYWVKSKDSYRVVVVPEPISPNRNLYDLVGTKTCDKQAPTGGDVVNIVFLNADSLEETLRHFEDHVAWKNELGAKLCAFKDDELGPQDEQRATHGILAERWHIRFFHESTNKRTLAAVHYDECNDSDGLGSPCNTFHHGARFNEGRDMLQGVFDFEKAGHVIATYDNVLYVTIK